MTRKSTALFSIKTRFGSALILSTALRDYGLLAQVHGLVTFFNISFFQYFNKFSLLCNSAMTPLLLRFFHILRYHQLPRHCLVEDNPLLVGKLGKLGKSKLGIFMYAHLFFQVNNKYNNYNIYIIIIIYIILIIRNIPCTH